MMKRLIPSIGLLVSLVAVPLAAGFSTQVQADEDGSFDEVLAQVTRKVSTNQKVIALTFDDGPSQTFTPQVLDLLRQYGARATFFVIGYRVKEYSNLVRQELSMRNEVANHTYSHIVVQGLSQNRVADELQEAHSAFLAETRVGETPFFRPPRGRYDKRVLSVAGAKGYGIVLWSVDSRDWSNPGTGSIIRRVLENVHPGDILLFHDQGGNRSQTIQALRVILPNLKSRGYRMVTVSDLMRMADSDPLK